MCPWTPQKLLPFLRENPLWLSRRVRVNWRVGGTPLRLQKARTNEAFPVGIKFKGVPKILTGPEQGTEHLPGWVMGLLCPPE